VEHLEARRWVEVAQVAAFGAGVRQQSLSVQVEGHPLALFRVDEDFYALDDICSHEYSRLSEGEIWDGEVYCAKHGSRFELATGAVHGLPATEPVRAYPVKVQEGRVYVLWPD
jgi:3-phenylpropionate/trans-cinnamate dioxygenase ferredoxin subunit